MMSAAFHNLITPIQGIINAYRPLMRSCIPPNLFRGLIRLCVNTIIDFKLDICFNSRTVACETQTTHHFPLFERIITRRCKYFHLIGNDISVVLMYHNDGVIYMIGQQVRRLRQQCKISQIELASQLGVSVRTVKNWEGDISNPNLECLFHLLKLFHTSADELLGLSSNDYLDLSGLDEKDKRKIKRAFQAYIDEDKK